MTKGSTILPTHTCFDDALDHLVERIQRDRKVIDSGRLHLVHGIAHAPEGSSKGVPFAHAWIEEKTEEGTVVWQHGVLGEERVLWSVERDEWYRTMGIEDVTRYTPREAWHENERTVHFGPWVERYEALCAKKGQRTRFEP